MSELPSGKATVGTMLGAMVLQISQQNDKVRDEALKGADSQGRGVVKKMSSRLLRMQSSRELLR